MNRVIVYTEKSGSGKNMDRLSKPQRDALYNMVCLACEGFSNSTMRRLWEANRRKSEFVYEDILNGIFYTFLVDRNSGQIRIRKAEAECAVSAKAA